jgi:hypothetical protein
VNIIECAEGATRANSKNWKKKPLVTSLVRRTKHWLFNGLALYDQVKQNCEKLSILISWGAFKVQIGSLQKNKVGLVKHPQLINMKQNKCPQVYNEVGCSLQVVWAWVKNGDEFFWEKKFHAANGKAQACTQGALLFFLLTWGVGGGGILFHFSLVPKCILTKFPSSS